MDRLSPLGRHNAKLRFAQSCRAQGGSRSATRFTLLVILALLAGCEDSKAGPARSRVDRVKAAPTKQGAVEAFCDVQPRAAFQLPALAKAAPASSGWRWVNVWATWCKPCIAEMPLLLRWRDRLDKSGKPLSLLFVSVDESDEVVAAYRQAHAGIPDSLRLANPDLLPPWLKVLGLDEAAPIPVHILVDPAGQTRCVRAGAVGEADYATIAELLVSP